MDKWTSGEEDVPDALPYQLLFTTLLLAMACSDYGIGPQHDVNGLGEGGTIVAPDGIPPAPDGADPGEDARLCWTLSAAAEEIEVDTSCESQGTLGSFEVITEWSRNEFGDYGETSQVLMAPVVAQLTDDNEDGVIDDQDIPDIVVVADDNDSYFNLHGILFIISGDGLSGSHGYFNGAVVKGEPDAETGVHKPEDGIIWEVGSEEIEEDKVNWEWHLYRYSNLALGDIDGDGVIEIAAILQGAEYNPPQEEPDGVDTAPVEPGAPPPRGHRRRPGPRQPPRGGERRGHLLRRLTHRRARLRLGQYHDRTGVRGPRPGAG